MRSSILAVPAIVLVAAGCSAAPAPAPSAHQWRTYANPRFAYQVCYPADLLRAQPEAPNGDGRVFIGAGGAKLSVWGRNKVDETLRDAIAQSTALLSDHGGQVTYKLVRPDWYVLSARQGDQIIYLRSRLVGDRFEAFELRYPAAAAASWNPVVARLGTCFRSLS